MGTRYTGHPSLRAHHNSPMVRCERRKTSKWSRACLKPPLSTASPWLQNSMPIRSSGWINTFMQVREENKKCIMPAPMTSALPKPHSQGHILRAASPRPCQASVQLHGTLGSGWAVLAVNSRSKNCACNRTPHSGHRSPCIPSTRGLALPL